MTTSIVNLTQQSVLYCMGVTCQPGAGMMFKLFRSVWDGQTIDDSEACQERFHSYFDRVMAEARARTKPLISDLLKAAQMASAT
jgi:hypothetical protein